MLHTNKHGSMSHAGQGQSSLSILPLLAPPIPTRPLLLIPLPVTRGIRPRPGRAVDEAQPHGGAAHGSPGADPRPQPARLPPPQGQEGVQPGPRGRQPGRRRREARQVDVRGREEGRREDEQRQGLPRPRVQGDDERGQQRGGQRRCWVGRVSAPDGFDEGGGGGRENVQPQSCRRDVRDLGTAVSPCCASWLPSSSAMVVGSAVGSEAGSGRCWILCGRVRGSALQAVLSAARAAPHQPHRGQTWVGGSG